jgi:hypothetical protein
MYMYRVNFKKMKQWVLIITLHLSYRIAHQPENQAREIGLRADNDMGRRLMQGTIWNNVMS